MCLKSSPIAEEDFCAVVRILATVASMDGGLDEKRSHLLCELGLLLRVDTYLWGVAPLIAPDQQPLCLLQDSGRSDDGRMALMLGVLERPKTGVMTARLAAEIIAAGGNINWLRQDLIDDDWFLHSGTSPIWRNGDWGPALFSTRPIPELGTSVVGFCRSSSAPPFSEREARVARIVLSEVGWLHETGMLHSAAKDFPKLPPRCRLILNQLVNGTLRKEIAADLGISVHTVNDYLKRIYRHFGVHSQVELIARLSHAKGSDRP